MKGDFELKGKTKTLRDLKRSLDWWKRATLFGKLQVQVSGLVNVANGLTKDTDTGNNLHYLLEYNRLAVSTKREDEDRQYRMDIGKQYLLNENKLLGANKQDVLAKIEQKRIF